MSRNIASNSAKAPTAIARLVKGKLSREDNIFIFLFIVTTLGGAIRKWFTTNAGLSNSILLLQMLIPFLWVVFRQPNRVNPFQTFSILGIFFFYLVIEIINPLQHTLFHGVIGILIYGGFWLGLMYYLANRTAFYPQRYGLFIFILAVGEIILAFIQYELPYNHILNTYADIKAVGSIALVGGRVRVTGTFSYLSGYTAFLLFYGFFTWALIRLRLPPWLYLLATAFGVIAGFMTGSRSALLLYGGFMVLVFLSEFPPQKLWKLLGQLILPGAIIFGVLLVLRGDEFQDKVTLAYDNFFSRVEENRASGEEQTRLLGDFTQFDFARLENPLFGIGTAATYQGAKQLFGTADAVNRLGYVESEFHKVLAEGGYLLFALKIALATIVCWQLAFKGMTRLFVWVMLVYGAPIVFNPHNASFIMMGIILIDNVLWRQQQEMFWQLSQKRSGEDVRTID